MTDSQNTQTTGKRSLMQFLRGEEGNGFVEKILIIALFAFVVAAGIKVIAGGANTKLEEQSNAIEGVNATIGGSGGAGGA